MRRMRLELLRAGVAPRRAARMVRELADHEADLQDAALRAGHAPREAAEFARRTLGTDDVIRDAVLERPELRSSAVRRPWLVYGLVPILVLSGSVLAVLLITVSAAGSVVELPAAARVLIGSLHGLVNFGLPVLLAAALLFSAARRRASVAWPLTGALLVIVVGAALKIAVVWPASAGEDGLLQVSYRYGRTEVAFGAALLFCLVGPYLAHRRLMI